MTDRPGQTGPFLLSTGQRGTLEALAPRFRQVFSKLLTVHQLDQRQSASASQESQARPMVFWQLLEYLCNRRELLVVTSIIRILLGARYHAGARHNQNCRL
jgi:hypothetical protein